jgi:hypothetical protein
MSASNTPSWLQGSHPRTRTHQWQKGQSGNPKGRPKGAKDKKTLVAEEFEKEGSAIARVVIDAALAGDIHAASLVLSRLQPVLRPRAERVQFELDTKGSLTEQARQVLVAIADGEVDPDTGRLVIDSIAAFSKLKEADELAERLQLIEQRLNVEARLAPLFSAPSESGK